MSEKRKRTSDPNVYWASLPATELVNEAHIKIQEFYTDLEETGLYYVIERLYRAYYGARLTGGPSDGQLFDSTELKQGGKNGEIIHLKINQLRSLIKHTLQLATSNKPAYSTKATNSDSKSQSQAILGDGLIEYYLREKKLQRCFTRATENALALTEGWVHCPWNARAGELYDVHPDTGAQIFEGDTEFSVKTLLDVARDPRNDGEKAHNWLIVRDWENRFELAAQHPELRDQILGVSSQGESYEGFESFNLRIRGDTRNDESVATWTLYHEVTDAMPQGRMVKFAGDLCLFDGPTPYRKIPLYRICPDQIIGTPYGYTQAFDLLGPQQGLDILNSTLMTNNAAHGVQSIWTKPGDDVDVKTLAGGMKNVQSEEMPQPLQLVKSAPETYDFRNQLTSDMETISGISATVRGNPEANLKSGSALALVVSQSIQFASQIEAAYNALFEDVGTAVLTHLRDFSKTKRVANIIGEANRPFRKDFTGDDLGSVNRITVEAASPLSKTVSGRIELARDLLQNGMIKTASQYIMVLTTGRLDPAIEGTQHDMLNMRAENEDLRNRKPVMAVLTDLHGEHINEHRSLLSNPDARKDPEFVRSVLTHIQEHLDLWRSADPAILMITGQQPPPPPLPPPGMMGPPPGPQGPGPQPPMGPTGNPAEVQRPQAPMEAQQPRQPGMPSLPTEAPASAQAAFDKLAGGAA